MFHCARHPSESPDPGNPRICAPDAAWVEEQLYSFERFFRRMV